MRIPFSQIRRIKEHNLPELMRGYGLTPASRNNGSYSFYCPFHDDQKTPSLKVNQKGNKWLWHCFGCDAGGSTINFIMKIESISFLQAFKKLSSGEIKTKPIPKIKPAPSKKDPIQDIQKVLNPAGLLNQVTDFYCKKFYENKKALDYLAGRGIKTGEIYKTFKIGYADGSLLKTLPESGPMIEALKQIGILNSKGKELFYNSVIFPVLDEHDNVTEIYARNLESKRHLYLPGPHKGVFNYKSASVYKEIILTEGIIDALSLYEIGHKNVIPLYGTNGLTEDHLELFETQGVKKIYLCLDNDNAGRQAAKKLTERLSDAGLAVGIIQLPADCKDPNDYLLKDGSYEAFKTLKEKAAYKTITQIEPDSKFKIRQEDDNIYISFAKRTYRIRGLSLSQYDKMRVNIKVSDTDNNHLDTLDLYSAKSRKVFVNQVNKILNVDCSVLEQELNVIVEELEIIQTTSKDDTGDQEKIKISDADKEKAFDLLTDLELTQRIIDDMTTLGYVGEDSNKILGYLISISRKLEEPLSAVIMSQSSAGKSGLTDTIEKLTPPEDCIMYSRITPQSLYYMDRTALKRKLLIIEEREGAESADYSIRTLQSRKRLTQAVPIKDPNTGKTRTQSFEVEGPVSYLETTTRPWINYENATRSFTIYLDETAEQTERIHQYQKQSKTLKGIEQKSMQDKICSLHHNAQRLLRSVKVINPFAEKISFPTQWLRTRRDHLRFLNLIEAVTFLHQYQREVKVTNEGTEYIESTIHDYRTAYKLAHDILGESLAELKKPQRGLLEQIEIELEKNTNGKSLTRRQIRELSGLPDHRVRNLLQGLVNLEYILVREGSNGRQYKYTLAEKTKGEKIFAGLTTPEELKALLKS